MSAAFVFAHDHPQGLEGCAMAFVGGVGAGGGGCCSPPAPTALTPMGAITCFFN